MSIQLSGSEKLDYLKDSWQKDRDKTVAAYVHTENVFCFFCKSRFIVSGCQGESSNCLWNYKIICHERIFSLIKTSSGPSLGSEMHFKLCNIKCVKNSTEEYYKICATHSEWFYWNHGNSKTNQNWKKMKGEPRHIERSPRLLRDSHFILFPGNNRRGYTLDLALKAGSSTSVHCLRWWLLMEPWQTWDVAVRRNMKWERRERGLGINSR